jgi:hypothetical protein
MKLVEITRQKQRIDELFSLASGLTPEIQAHWSRYLCIMVAGFLEVSVQAIYSEYARGKAHPNVVNYVERRMRGFQNPNMQRIGEVARSFSVEWGAELEKEATIRDSVNSILNNRNQIAHGRSTDVTIGRLRPWYVDTVRLVEIMKVQCGV